MNRQIEEFKIRSLEWNTEDQVWQINAEKFAELIVRHCADVLHQDTAFMPELGVYAHDMVVKFGFKYE
jgi:hypothetical protein